MHPSAPASKPRIAFLGLGLMGSGMAARILAAGFPLTVFNRDRAKAEKLVAAGARAAATPADAAREADVIISMLADDTAARALWLGETGALTGAARGALCIESSTVTVTWIRELAAAAQARGCECIDAPVTGSRLAAAAGELNFLVGGTETALERARPVLAAMSKTIALLGPVGSGAMAKLINNFVCGVQVAALAEAVALIERSGLDRQKALDVMLNGAPGSPLVKTIAARMTARDYTPNFLLRLLRKDVAYAMAEAEKHAVPLATAAAAGHVLDRGIAAGHGDKDMAAAIEAFR